LPRRLNKDRQVNDLKFKQFVAIVTFCFLLSCKGNPEKLTEIHGKQLSVDASISQTDSLVAYVAPFKQRIDRVLDSTLSHAPEPLLLEDGTRNTSLGNLIADIVFEETAPLFQGRTGLELDFVVLNQGGLRSIIPAGPVSARNAYEVMPFENFIVVVELNGTAMLELIDFLSKARWGHPISGIEIVLDKNGSLESVDIQGRPFDENRNYFVATSDYLVQGGPSIGFFDETVSVTHIDYLMRSALIDHFGKRDTLRARVDDRFIQLGQ